MSVSGPTVVISQPMYFPWVGLLEQIRLADIYVHYGDVQFSKGSFVNRVQVKTAGGRRWLTVPLDRSTLGQSIDSVAIDGRKDWVRSQRDLLRQACAGAPHCEAMLQLFDAVHARSYSSIGALSRASIHAVCDLLGLGEGCRFVEIDSLGIGGRGSQRVLDVVSALGGGRYVTGWGARSYLDHEAFEAAGIAVEYMEYRKLPYPQLHGDFMPYVSSLDLVANLGVEGAACIQSETVSWRDFVDHE